LFGLDAADGDVAIGVVIVCARAAAGARAAANHQVRNGFQDLRRGGAAFGHNICATHHCHGRGGFLQIGAAPFGGDRNLLQLSRLRCGRGGLRGCRVRTE